MKRFGLVMVIFLLLFISTSVDAQKENDTESLQIEEFHFIVDTGANYVSLTPEMIEVLGLKDRLGEVTDLRLAAGKTAWGQKIVYPSISVLGMEEQDVSGIAIPEKQVGIIDGLLGRSFLKRFVVCFDYEQGPKIQLTPKRSNFTLKSLDTSS